MRSVISHPTPQRVIDAIHVVAAWLREIDAAEALISSVGGAAFYEERPAEKYLDGWGEADAELVAARARITDLEEALSGLLAACDAADAREDLSELVDGSLMDAAHEALDAARHVEGCVWCKAGHTIVEDGYHWFGEHAKKPCGNARRA